MSTSSLAAVLLLAQDRADPELLRRALSLWVLLAILGLILIFVVALLLAGRRRRRMRVTRERRSKPLKDAWVEAGRRVKPADLDDPEEPGPGDWPPPPEGRYS